MRIFHQWVSVLVMPGKNLLPYACFGNPKIKASLKDEK